MLCDTSCCALASAEPVRGYVFAAFNWALFKPHTTTGSGGLDFFNAGSGSIEEMRRWLPADEVLFGLLRLGFASGRFRRTKFIFVHWSGCVRVVAVCGRVHAMALYSFAGRPLVH